MPELPEVETTARELNRLVKGRRIVDVWTEYKSAYWRGKEEIKNPKYFLRFKKAVIGSRIVGASRRAKNVLIHLDGEQQRKVRSPIHSINIFVSFLHLMMEDISHYLI